MIPRVSVHNPDSPRHLAFDYSVRLPKMHPAIYISPHQQKSLWKFRLWKYTVVFPLLGSIVVIF